MTEDHTYFIGPCTCEHDKESHSWGRCDVPGTITEDCPCEAGWEE